MVTGVIFAGGKSKRFGSDKALLGGVERIAGLMRKCDFTRVVVLCGNSERSSLFKEECWPDPHWCDGILEVIKWAIGKIDDEIQLAPCDAIYLDEEVVSKNRGVPLDENGLRQPLLARLPRGFIPNGDSITEMMSEIKSQEFKNPIRVRNVNRPEDLLK